MSNGKWVLWFLLVPLLVLGVELLLAHSGMGEQVFQATIFPAHFVAYGILMFAYHRKNAFNIKTVVGFSIAYVFGAFILTMIAFWAFIGIGLSLAY